MARTMTRTMRRLLRTLRPKRSRRGAIPHLVQGLLRAFLDARVGTAARRKPVRAKRYSVKGVQHRVERAQGKFFDSIYRNPSGARRYKLFVPTDGDTSSLPLVVMLHGCSQTPDELAMVSGMNELAASQRFVAVYPVQSTAANRSKCWNWFVRSDQQRGRGEPAILAGLARHLIKAYGLDRQRVYVAGLSAGAAMAVILGRVYPDLFAAVGVHSGLAHGAAHDVESAFAAMRGDSITPSTGAVNGRRVPIIAMHGDQDRIVHPRNLQCILDQFIEHDPAAFLTEERKIQDRAGSRSCICTVLRDANGMAVFEHWLVHGGGHAWFGGNARIRYADPDGPNASQEMLRFFFQHSLQASSPPGNRVV